MRMKKITKRAKRVIRSMNSVLINNTKTNLKRNKRMMIMMKMKRKMMRRLVK